MAGLLDALASGQWGGTDDQNSAMNRAIFSLGAGLLSRTHGVPFTKALGDSLLGAQQQYDAYGKAQVDAAYKKALTADAQSQAEIRKNQALLAAQKNAFGAELAAAASKPDFKFTPGLVARGAALGFKPEDMKAMAESGDWGKSEVKWVDAAGPNNEPGKMAVDKFGRATGQWVPAAVAKQMVDTGGSMIQVDPYSGNIGPRVLGKSVTPDAAMGDATRRFEGAQNRAVTMRGQDMTDARAREALAAPASVPLVTNEGVVGVNPRTNTAVPITMAGKPGETLQKPLDAAAAKQITGVRTFNDAADAYVKELNGWSNAKMLSPDARAAIGSKYQNMLLQAKEAYNLGVLNGPDFQILQSVLTNPLTMSGALVSNEAMKKQISELKRIMQGVEAQVRQIHQPGAVQSEPATRPPLSSFGG